MTPDGENETCGICHKEGDEHLISRHSAQVLIGTLLERMELESRVGLTLPRWRESKITQGDIVKWMIGLLCMGKHDYVM